MALPLRAIALAVALTIIPPAGAAETEIDCRSARPAGAREYWSWREVDGRRCWYAGRPGLAKGLLRWGEGSVRVSPASNLGEVAPTADVPAARFSETVLSDRWNAFFRIFLDPTPIEQWRLP
jgi:hypothetical protein